MMSDDLSTLPNTVSCSFNVKSFSTRIGESEAMTEGIEFYDLLIRSSRSLELASRLLVK